MRKLLLASLLMPLFAMADQSTLPDAPPPPTVGEDTGEPTATAPTPPVITKDQANQADITSRQRGDETWEEYRRHGKLYMIRVTPAHGHPYYLIDDNGDGQFHRHNLLHNAVQPPMWILKQW